MGAYNGQCPAIRVYDQAGTVAIGGGVGLPHTRESRTREQAPEEARPHVLPIILFCSGWSAARLSPSRRSQSCETGSSRAPTNSMRSVPVGRHSAAAARHNSRDGVPVPSWVRLHRYPADTVLFGDTDDGWYGRWLRRGRAPAVCEYHRVWFHRRLLDKGTPDWWLPWN